MTPREFAERALLGVVLQEPSHIRPMREWLAAEDFRAPAHQRLWSTMDSMVTDADARSDRSLTDVNPVTVLHHVHEPEAGDWRGELDDAAAERSGVLTGPGLHTLIATAPAPSQAQPEAYGAIVLEASIRRQVAAAGMRVGQTATGHADLDEMLTSVDQALTQVQEAAARWDVTERASSEANTATAVLASGHAPDENAVYDAEYGLVSEVLTNPSVLNELASSVQPDDFADAELGATYRAAVAVHHEHAAGGPAVDPITVAWQQQRQQVAQHGPGLETTTLADIAHRSAPLGPAAAASCASTVLHGSVARRAAAAAETVQQAAQHPSMRPHEVLSACTAALHTVRDAARRAQGPVQLARQASSPTSPQPAQRRDIQPAARTPDRACTASPTPTAYVDRNR